MKSRHCSLTIVVVSGGNDAYVGRAVQSALLQECPPDELIVFLNGRSPEVKHELKVLVKDVGVTRSIDPDITRHVRFIESEKYLVTTDAMVLVLESVTSDYLVILDDDDLLDPTFTRQLFPYLDLARPDEVFVVRHQFFSDDGRVFANTPSFARKVGASPWRWVNRLAASFPAQFATGGTAIPTRLLRNTDAYSAPFGVVQTDGLSSLRLARNGYRAYYVGSAVYFVRRHPNYSKDKSWKFDNGMGVLRALCISESIGRTQQFNARLCAGDRLIVRDQGAYIDGLSKVHVRASVKLIESRVLYWVTRLTFWSLRRIAYILSLRRWWLSSHLNSPEYEKQNLGLSSPGSVTP